MMSKIMTISFDKSQVMKLLASFFFSFQVFLQGVFHAGDCWKRGTFRGLSKLFFHFFLNSLLHFFIPPFVPVMINSKEESNRKVD